MLYSHISFTFVVALMVGSSLAHPSAQKGDEAISVHKRAPDVGGPVYMNLGRRENKPPNGTPTTTTTTTTTSAAPGKTPHEPEEAEFPDETGDNREVDVPEENGKKDDDDDDDDDDSDDEDENHNGIPDKQEKGGKPPGTPQ